MIQCRFRNAFSQAGTAMLVNSCLPVATLYIQVFSFHAKLAAGQRSNVFSVANSAPLRPLRETNCLHPVIISKTQVTLYRYVYRVAADRQTATGYATSRRNIRVRYLPYPVPGNAEYLSPVRKRSAGENVKHFCSSESHTGRFLPLYIMNALCR